MLNLVLVSIFQRNIIYKLSMNFNIVVYNRKEYHNYVSSEKILAYFGPVVHILFNTPEPKIRHLRF